MTGTMPASAIIRGVKRSRHQRGQLLRFAAHAILRNRVVARRDRIAHAHDVTTPSTLREERTHRSREVVGAVAGCRTARIEQRSEGRVRFDRDGDVCERRIGGTRQRAVGPAMLFERVHDCRRQRSARHARESDKARDIRAGRVGFGHRTRVVKSNTAHGAFPRKPAFAIRSQEEAVAIS